MLQMKYAASGTENPHMPPVILACPDTTGDDAKSVYSVLAMYINNAEKNGMYVKGYIDGEEMYNAFMREFIAVCGTKFTTRTSWRKEASALPRRTRYGKEERVYWEYNSGNLEVPFTGVPFVVRSCLTKHCQYGTHYYKTTAERVSRQYLDSQLDPTIPPPELKKRRNKPSKKKNCPAIMHIREVIMFPDFSLQQPPPDGATDYHVRKQKSQQILRLKQTLAEHATQCRGEVNGVRRFYINIPLPEVHDGHQCGAIAPRMYPAVASKIDQLLGAGIYDARHVRVIVHDFVQEELLRNSQLLLDFDRMLLFPSEHDVADYIYVASITAKPTVVVVDDVTDDVIAESGVEDSIDELVGLIQTCRDQAALQRLKLGMEKMIKTVQGAGDSVAPPARKKPRAESVCCEDGTYEVSILPPP